MDLRTISLAIGTVLIARLLHELTEDLRVALRRGFVWETPSVSSQNRPSSCSPCLVDIVSLLRIEYRDQLVHGYISIRLVECFSPSLAAHAYLIIPETSKARLIISSR